jgi:hypothetical protein
MALFDEVPVVGLGEAHWVEQQHSLIIELLLDARFAQIVDDVVVEFGNALHQLIVDRFLGGKDVAWADLRRAWQETVGGACSGVFDSPVYDRFFRGVRMACNTLGPGTHRLQLGDPPFDPRSDGPGLHRTMGHARCSLCDLGGTGGAQPRAAPCYWPQRAFLSRLGSAR